ncbi:MAG: hypothetical protein FJ215_09410 [Ignavibacteria bacterium]|nr:hypothetical protein [Ignavibacteria bacterium]
MIQCKHCFFVSDLHGKVARFRRLFAAIRRERPIAVFLGGDLFVSPLQSLADVKKAGRDTLQDVINPGFKRLKRDLGVGYPRVFVILGNDDGRMREAELEAGERERLWDYVHAKHVPLNDYRVYGYTYVPPTPFFLKDWERYDVSKFVDPGCIPPEEGWHSIEELKTEAQRTTIQDDLDRLVGKEDLSRSIFLFHAPPYRTALDRAALDGKAFDHAPLDVHVGSIAIKRFIEARQPLLTLHGHVHESPRITGSWKECIGRTYAFSAAHDGPELALIRFDLDYLDRASRVLL